MGQVSMGGRATLCKNFAKEKADQPVDLVTVLLTYISILKFQHRHQYMVNMSALLSPRTMQHAILRHQFVFVVQIKGRQSRERE